MSKKKKLLIENENLKRMNKKGINNAFMIGATFGALLVGLSLLLVKKTPVEKIINKFERVKKKMTTSLDNTLENIETEIEGNDNTQDEIFE